jgi:hypothetical protein
MSKGKTNIKVIRNIMDRPRLGFSHDMKRHPSIRYLLFNSLSLNSLEVGHRDMRHQSVELFLGVFRVGSLSGQSNAESVRHRFDAFGPNGLVQRGVQTNVRGSHVLLGKGLDRLDGFGSSLLESAFFQDF